MRETLLNMPRSIALLLLAWSASAWTGRQVPRRRLRARAPRAAKTVEDIQTAADSVLETDKLMICPALATSNVAMLGAEVESAVAAGADAIHVNVMDGHFTRKMTLGPMFVKALRAHGITAPLDVQLTACDVVDTLVEEFAAAGANYITFHPEGTYHVDRTLSLIKKLGLKAGVVLNPGTPVSILEPILGKVDIVLLMSINPGFPAEAFNENVYGKAKVVSKMIADSGRRIRLQVDGGAGLKNIQQLAECGIDTFVVGRGVFHADDYAAAIAELRGLAEAGAAQRCS